MNYEIMTSQRSLDTLPPHLYTRRLTYSRRFQRCSANVQLLRVCDRNPHLKAYYVNYFEVLFMGYC